MRSRAWNSPKRRSRPDRLAASFVATRTPLSPSDGMAWGVGAIVGTRSRVRGLAEWVGEWSFDENVVVLQPPYRGEDVSIAPLESGIPRFRALQGRRGVPGRERRVRLRGRELQPEHRLPHRGRPRDDEPGVGIGRPHRLASGREGVRAAATATARDSRGHPRSPRRRRARAARRRRTVRRRSTARSRRIRRCSSRTDRRT